MLYNKAMYSHVSVQPVLFFFPSPGNNPVVGQYNMNLQGLVNSTLEVLNSGQFSIALFTGGAGAGGGSTCRCLIVVKLLLPLHLVLM